MDNQSEAEEAGFDDTAWQGVFLMRGQSLSISSFTITQHDDGEVSASSPTISTSTHMAPYWLAAAVRHARDAERLSHFTNKAFHGDKAESKAEALNREMVASMQAITCAAIAIDALYSTLLKIHPTPELIQHAWKKNKTKRSRQIFETIRRAFKMGPKSQADLRQFLDQLTDARDKAVHPQSKTKVAEKHARLPVAVDPAFNLFRARNALVAVGLAIELVESTARAKTAKSAKTVEQLSSLLELVQPVHRSWLRSRVGKAFAELQRRAAASNKN